MGLLATWYFSLSMYAACSFVLGVILIPQRIARMEQVILPFVVWTMYAFAVCLFCKFVNSKSSHASNRSAE
jgi:hypothetical protein